MTHSIYTRTSTLSGIFNSGVADKCNPPGREIVVPSVAGVQLSLRALPCFHLEGEGGNLGRGAAKHVVPGFVSLSPDARMINVQESVADCSF